MNKHFQYWLIGVGIITAIISLIGLIVVTPYAPVVFICLFVAGYLSLIAYGLGLIAVEIWKGRPSDD